MARLLTQVGTTARTPLTLAQPTDILLSAVGLYGPLLSHIDLSYSTQLSDLEHTLLALRNLQELGELKVCDESGQCTLPITRHPWPVF